MFDIKYPDKSAVSPNFMGLYLKYMKQAVVVGTVRNFAHFTQIFVLNHGIVHSFATFVLNYKKRAVKNAKAF